MFNREDGRRMGVLRAEEFERFFLAKVRAVMADKDAFKLEDRRPPPRPPKGGLFDEHEANRAQQQAEQEQAGGEAAFLELFQSASLSQAQAQGQTQELELEQDLEARMRDLVLDDEPGPEAHAQAHKSAAAAAAAPAGPARAAASFVEQAQPDDDLSVRVVKGCVRTSFRVSWKRVFDEYRRLQGTGR